MNLGKEIYRVEQLPVFQNRMFRSTEEAKNCTKGDVVLVQDLETGLIFNQAFQPELMEYDADYQNETAVSAQFCKHLEHVTEVIRSHFWGESLIEVGCGKGYFLESLQEIGFEITGLDPTYEGSNTNIIKEYFTPTIGVKADGIILRHVLEHVKDPIQFLFNICEANGGSGKIYIEVPCFDWICKHRAWFDICYEHVNYFRLADFLGMFDLVHEAGHMFNGKFLYVLADLATLKVPTKDPSVELKFPEDFLDKVEYYATKLKSQKTTAAIWGGATKGVIFALLLDRKGTKIDTIIDINPAKQGKYIAGTGIQINSLSQVINNISNGADIFVMNSNYLSEINEMTEYRLNLISVE
jgi:Methyltransferase domain/C-methyltransferase C-terminal domain